LECNTFKQLVGLLSDKPNSSNTNKDTKFENNDFRSTIPRFSSGNWEHNVKLVDYVNELANKKNCTPAQIALSWLLHQKPFIAPIPGTKKVARIKENISSENITALKKTRRIFCPSVLSDLLSRSIHTNRHVKSNSPHTPQNVYKMRY
jgi:aryl-alcohol dehydrogenase-like predicted oxidoreductase